MKTLDGTLYRRALDCSGPQSAHTRVVSRAGGQSPLWVKNGSVGASKLCLRYPTKQTSTPATATSVSCQERKWPQPSCACITDGHDVSMIGPAASAKNR